MAANRKHNKADKNDEDYQKVGDIVKQFVKKNRLQNGLNQVNIEHIWESQLGPGIAKHTQGLKLSRHTLYVQLDSSVLREELSYGKGKIIQMLNENLGQEVIKKLVLR